MAIAQRAEDSRDTHTGTDGRDFLWTAFILILVRLKRSRLYNIPDAHVNSPRHIFKLLFTWWVWTRFFLACYPRNLCGISAWKTSTLFTFGIKCIFCYFFVPCIQLLYLHQHVKRSSSYYHTYIVINCVLKFRTTIIFGCFRAGMGQFEII